METRKGERMNFAHRAMDYAMQAEKRLLLDVLTKADPRLVGIARAQASV